MSDQSNERRCKIYRIDCRTIMTLLGNWWHHEGINLPVLKGVPEGYIIRRIHYDFSYDAIALLVEHESFPEVPEGGVFPISTGLAEFEFVSIPIPQPVERVAKALGTWFKTETTVGTAAAIPSNDILKFNPESEPPNKKVPWEFLGSP